MVAEETAAALALWRGAPLSGLYDPADGEPALVQRLGETRLLVLEWKYEAELRLGRHEGIGPELAALTGQFPLREAFHRQLMLVLHRTGRQAEALAVHQRLRRTLVEELGVDPGPAVQEAHREILREPTPRADLPTPAQLPPGPAHFTGRDDLVGQLWAALAQRRQPEAPADALAGHPVAPAALRTAAARHEGAPTAALAVITGMAGVGKSALAVHVAHALREEFPDGQLYLNLRGATPGSLRSRRSRRSPRCSTPWASTPATSPTRPTRRPRCCAPGSPRPVRSSSSTTRPPPPRCGRCCPPGTAARWS